MENEKTFEIKTEYKEIVTPVPVIVLKIDKMTAANLCNSLREVLYDINVNQLDGHQEMNYEMVKKFWKALSSEVNSTKR